MSENTIRQWDAAAYAYAEIQERSAYADVNKAVVKERFPKLSGEAVLDLGCGYGFYTDYFNRIGGAAVGIDGAQTMIRIARETYPGNSFSVADITKRLPFENGTFDIVFCNMVLMDIEDIGCVFAEAARVLKPGGVFWYSVVHPAFYNGDWQTDANGRKTGKLIAAYLTPESYLNHFPGGTVHFHRPLSHYLNAAADAGLVLTYALEPRTYDGITKNDDLPLFFFAEYRANKT